MQGSAERSDRDRPALSGGMDALSGAAAAAQGRHGFGQRRSAATTPGSISSTRSGSARNVPIDTGNGSEGLLALKDGKWVVLRVPYPTGFYTKWMDGRIDDPNGGWKGKGLWARRAHARRSTWRAAEARPARS